jgi:hypothetical protein
MAKATPMFEITMENFECSVIVMRRHVASGAPFLAGTPDALRALAEDLKKLGEETEVWNE